MQDFVGRYSGFDSFHSVRVGAVKKGCVKYLVKILAKANYGTGSEDLNNNSNMLSITAKASYKYGAFC